MAISIRHDGDVPILDMEGDFALGRSASVPVDPKGILPEDLRERILHLLGAGQIRIVLNLAEVRFIDSAAVGELIACLKRTMEKGGSIRLLHPAGQVKEVLRLTLLSEVFEIYQDEAEAVASFGARG